MYADNTSSALLFSPRLLFDSAYLSRPSSYHWRQIATAHAPDERTFVDDLCLYWSESTRASSFSETEVSRQAQALIRSVRAAPSQSPLQELLQEYQLGSAEGVLLMSMAESLLRIPDAETAQQLIEDCLLRGDWQSHLSEDHLLSNLSSMGLMFSSYLLDDSSSVASKGVGALFHGLVKRLGGPLLHQALMRLMAHMGESFVLGESMEGALAARSQHRREGVDFSFDMLGEAAMCQADAEGYVQAYTSAIEHVAEIRVSKGEIQPSISIKLSALSPRYEVLKPERIEDDLLPRLFSLLDIAIEKNVAVTLDAEEMDRLDLSLQIFEHCLTYCQASHYASLGLAVQAYSKRSLAVLVWLAALARERKTAIPVRLVKGAYWDSEIKKSQQRGERGYPVFTEKAATDLSYLCCAQLLLSREGFYPQFATHNAHTLVAVDALARQLERPESDYEFQRLFGMGEALYDRWLAANSSQLRIYAPVGSHKQLLPYLVRRLLENGANTSFVQQIADEHIPAAELARSPLELCRHLHLSMSLPDALFAPDRRNSRGLNVADREQRETLQAELAKWRDYRWRAATVINGEPLNNGMPRACIEPGNVEHACGELLLSDASSVLRAFDSARAAFGDWKSRPVAERARILKRFAGLLEQHCVEFFALCQREAGKTINDAIDEVREAVDFCRYYAEQAEQLMTEPVRLPGPTGEDNRLFLEGRGVVACVSPWNFPLAIFIGQVAAALVSGNTVIAKPSQKTALIAARAVELLFEAGLPPEVLQLLVCDTEAAEALWSQPLDGVAFTGSDATAKHLNRKLAENDGPIAALVAETGGLNAMIVDSTALPEQVVRDVLDSAFRSAGQRCSALRVLIIQEELADTVMALLKGAMAELEVGDPSQFRSDIGPVIDASAKDTIDTHVDRFRERGRVIAEVEEQVLPGSYVAPVVIELETLAELKEEIFGPVLHVLRYRSDSVDEVMEALQQSGYGLTLSIHSRRMGFADQISERARVGNIYINRNQIGAVVGVQPFGGMGRSGTGPKAGGPHYLMRFVTEKTVSTNTAAIGGDLRLLSK